MSPSTTFPPFETAAGSLRGGSAASTEAAAGGTAATPFADLLAQAGPAAIGSKSPAAATVATGKSAANSGSASPDEPDCQVDSDSDPESESGSVATPLDPLLLASMVPLQPPPAPLPTQSLALGTAGTADEVAESGSASGEAFAASPAKTETSGFTFADRRSAGTFRQALAGFTSVGTSGLMSTPASVRASDPGSDGVSAPRATATVAFPATTAGAAATTPAPATGPATTLAGVAADQTTSLVQSLASAEGESANASNAAGSDQSVPASATGAEKIAASASGSPDAALNSKAVPDKNESLLVDNKQEVKSIDGLGTETAKKPAKMAARFEQPTPEAKAPDGVIRVEASIGLRTLDGQSAAPVKAGVESQAATTAGVIRDVMDLAEDVRTRDRSSVEVQFRFRDDTQLSVRVAYRDGAVQTTFRTDSHELREALGREWQAQAAAGDGRAYRLAEPVFTSSQASSTGSGPAGQGSNFSMGGDNPRHSSQQAQHSPFHRSSSSSQSAGATPVRAAVEPGGEGTLQRLHAFA